MPPTVDSYRFTSRATKRVLKSWVKLETLRPIPWTPLPKPLPECTVALVSSGGIALEEEPFDQAMEWENPWRGDPSYRVIPRTAKTDNISVYHLHINPALGEEDMNCLLPIERLNTLAAKGEIGRSAPSHYAYMGYTVDPEELLAESVPAMIENLQAEEVDVVVLVPA
ncbi:MAG: D-proline reductase subunit gamma [Chloroflexi bacterium]|nr:D-proline reductase subunit gamma [Chloroflexota bacterium]